MSGFSRTPVGPPEGGHYGPMKSAVVRRAGPWAESFQNRQSVAKSVIRQAANSLPVQVLPRAWGLHLRGPMVRFLVTFALILPIAACTKSPTSPSGDGASGLLRGQTVSAVDGSASPNLSVRIGERTVTSDGNGMFEMEMGSSGTYRSVIRGGGVVERETRISGPGAAPARVSLIPSTFDLQAFDEMFRTSNSQLQRWTSRPALVVLASVMDYRGVGDTYEATAEQLSEEELTLMVLQLTEGLGLLTGGTVPHVRVDRRRASGGGDESQPVPLGEDRRRALQRDRDFRADDWVRTVVSARRWIDFRRRDLSRSRLRSERQPPAAVARPRARPCARIPARRDADLGHEPGDRTRAERLRSHRFDHRLPASGGKSIS